MSRFTRRCAVLLTAIAVYGAVALGTAAWAGDDFSRVDRDPVAGAQVRLAGGQDAPTFLYSLRMAREGAVRAYGADVGETVRGDAAYVEADWDEVADAGSAAPHRVNWVVHHSYPRVGLRRLAAASGARALSEEHAIAATQAAIWHLAGDVRLDRDPQENPAEVIALYDHLVSGAAGARDTAAGPSLALTPQRIDASAPQEPVGPLTVSGAGADAVRLSVRGAPASWLVDARGEGVSRVSEGDEVFLRIDPAVPAGVATVQVRAKDVPLEAGRLFTGRDGVRTQPLVTAEPGTTTSTAASTVVWDTAASAESGGGGESGGPEDEGAPDSGPEPRAPAGAAPEGSAPAPPHTAPGQDTAGGGEDASGSGLARTGTWLSGLLAIAAILVASGGAALVVARRKANKSDPDSDQPPDNDHI